MKLALALWTSFCCFVCCDGSSSDASKGQKLDDDAFGLDGFGTSQVNCRHGTFDNLTKKCICAEGWATAGITDTLDFLEGVCEQYQCKSDSKCQEVLGIPDATCPIPNWNCYCGFHYAIQMHGHGYETRYTVGGGECMGVMYAFSVWATHKVEFLLQVMWMIFLPLAVISLPFGRKRSICDHHWPSMWNGIRSVCGCWPECNGDCVMSTTYSMDMLKDDVAWTIYFLDVMVWLYVFLCTLWCVTMFIWSVILWLAVLVIISCLLCLTACGALTEGGGLAGGSCDGCGPMDFGCCGADIGGGGSTAGGIEMFYWGGLFPYDPLWGYSGLQPIYGPGDDVCSSGCFSCCCRPIALLLFVFPVMPENAWGGFMGYYCFGTHALTPTDALYRGGNPFIEFMRMGWRRRVDLHGEDEWRRRVHDFLSGPMEEPRANGPAGYVSASTQQPSEELQSFVSPVGAEHEIVAVGRAKAIRIETSFNMEDHRPVPSSFEDYQNNRCWICQDEKPEWDLWLSCHHLFCVDCSSEMLRRRMPCPLCRVSSTAVLRGYQYAG